jgi:hypothetical protein
MTRWKSAGAGEDRSGAEIIHGPTLVAGVLDKAVKFASSSLYRIHPISLLEHRYKWIKGIEQAVR